MSVTVEKLVAPERSREQRMEALVNANRIRSERASLKRRLRARDVRPARVSVVRLLVEPPEFVATMKVVELLLAVPKVGRVKANRMLAMVRVSPSKSIGGLSERQRLELARLLVGRRSG